MGDRLRAAGVTAIVTGRKTHTGVVALSDSAVRGTKDGEPLKTILEHDEERGPSTGVVSNGSVLPVTPAACYVHAEKVGVAAQGPGAERVRDFLSNADVFHVMMAAYGWEQASAAGRR